MRDGVVCERCRIRKMDVDETGMCGDCRDDLRTDAQDYEKEIKATGGYREAQEDDGEAD